MSNNLRTDNLVIFSGRFTVDGTALNGSRINLVRDDGLPEICLRVRRLVIFNDSDNAPPKVSMSGVVSTKGGSAAGGFFDLDNKEQVAWTQCSTDGTTMNMQTPMFELVDPTNIIVREMWLRVWLDSGIAAQKVNYYVECETILLSDVESVIALANDVAYIT